MNCTIHTGSMCVHIHNNVVHVYIYIIYVLRTTLVCTRTLSTRVLVQVKK